MSDYSNQQEYRLRNLLRSYFTGIEGIERVPMSGAANLTKGDIADRDNRLPVFIDHKSTRGAGNISVSREDLEKLLIQGRSKKYHIMSLGFFKDDKFYGVMPLDELLSLLVQVCGTDGKRC